jgi:prepilin-type N-terminal cleavage/methylation domain-containing protein
MIPTRRTGARGFSLLEMMIALAILALVFIGLLRVLDSSTRTSKTEAALAEVQENVRFSVHHIRHVAAMAGGGDLPLVNESGWVAAGLESNLEGRFVDDLGSSHAAMVGSDALTLRGFFEHRPYLVDADLDPLSPLGADLMLRPDGGTIRVRDRVGDQDQELERPGIGCGLVLMGQGRYAVGEIEEAELETVDLPDGSPGGGTRRARVLTIVFSAGGEPWDGFNPGGSGYRSPAFDVSRVAALDSYSYFVDPGLRLMRVRGRSRSASVIGSFSAVA